MFYIAQLILGLTELSEGQTPLKGLILIVFRRVRFEGLKVVGLSVEIPNEISFTD